MTQGSITLTVALSLEDTGGLFLRSMHYSVCSVSKGGPVLCRDTCRDECQGWHILESSFDLEKIPGSGSVQSKKDKVS